MQVCVTGVIMFVYDIRLILEAHPGHIPVGQKGHFFISQVFLFSEVQGKMYAIVFHSFIERRTLTKALEDIFLA